MSLFQRIGLALALAGLWMLIYDPNSHITASVVFALGVIVLIVANQYDNEGK